MVGVGSGGGGGRVWAGQGRCEQRSEVFVKIPKKIYISFFFWGGGVRSGGREGVQGRGGGGSQGGCEQRIEVFVTIQKKLGGGVGVRSGGGGVGVREDVAEK